MRIVFMVFIGFWLGLGVLSLNYEPKIPVPSHNRIPAAQTEYPQTVKPSNQELHWAYDGEAGPQMWGNLKKDYQLCSYGKQQSPIDLKATTKATLGKIIFHYQNNPLRIINNGHSIQVNINPGSTAIIRGETYQLEQFHFHSPSEHKLMGENFPLEVHFVHKNAAGKIAVIGMFIKKGKINQAFEKIWKYLPPKEGEEKSVPNATIALAELLPKETAYYHYEGSLTTPPCNEGVNWNILRTPITLSAEQITRFQWFYHANARPLQQTGSRQVAFSP